MLKLLEIPLSKTTPGAKEGYDYVLTVIQGLHNSPNPMLDISEVLISACPELSKSIKTAADYLDNAPQLPYHSARHHAIVSMFAVLIGRYQKLEREKMRELLLTAIVHDLGYSPIITKSGPGIMERTSIVRAHELGIVEDEDLGAIINLNNATIFPSGREGVLNSPNKIDVRRVLSDSDLIGSCGVSVKNYEYETSLIEEEGGFKLNPQARYGFLKSVGPLTSVAGTFFQDAQVEILERQKKLAEAI